MSIGAPLPPATPDGTPSDDGAFDGLIDAAVRERLVRQVSAAPLLETGELDPVRLCRYAAGALEGAERGEAERVLARSRWALGRVSALVRGARQEGSVAARLLRAARGGADLEPTRVVGAALLEALGRDPSAAEAALASDPSTRAAALLSLGRADEAHRTLAALPSSGDPLLDLARRVSQPAADPLRPWVALLEAL